MKANTGVFNRRNDYDQIGERSFFFILGLALIYGLGGTALIAHHFAQKAYVPDMLAIIFLGLVIPIIGIIIAIKSDNPIISFIGYNMVLIPFGIILAPILNTYSPDVIRNAFGITCVVTATMMILSTIYPAFFSKIGGILFSALLGLVIVRVIQLFVPALGAFTFIDWISAGIFSLYIGYDWYRANEVPKTIDNAIDIAIDLYLDIINLFISILSILAKSDSD